LRLTRLGMGYGEFIIISQHRVIKKLSNKLQ